MNRLPVRAVGLPWYLRQDYPRILDIMEDAENLPATWFEWNKKAERHQRDAERQGHIVIRAVIDPDDFPDWCRTRGLNVDAEARQHHL